MDHELDNAKQQVTQLYNQLAPIADEIVSKYSRDIDQSIHVISGKIEILTPAEIRQYILKLSIDAYMFGSAKDQSLLRQECATTLLKESQARIYNDSDGTQVARSNTAVVQTVDKQVINLLYTAVSNLMKTKLDEAHRVVGALNSVLISRNAEAKLERELEDNRPYISQVGAENIKGGYVQ